VPAVQVAVLFGMAGHGRHELPQLAALVLSAHVVPHAWNPVPHVTLQR
jgi:hypothetical protein